LNKASAENIMKDEAITKGTLNMKFSHSCQTVNLNCFNCNLMIAAPETLKAAYKKIYKIVFCMSIGNGY
jgi:hypothetical protein